jgi:alkylation response protein AidB-like acyl-CoA dehydrogenase
MMNQETHSVHRWVRHLPDHLTITAPDWDLITALPDHLTMLARVNDAGAARLLRSKAALARLGYGALSLPLEEGGAGRPAIVQAVVQFVVGYFDVDNRDIAGVGHGRLIAKGSSPSQYDRWMPAVLDGALVGIAATEAHGGSQFRAIQATAIPVSDGVWALNGTKHWISRLGDASLFVVFFRLGAGGPITAAVVDPATPGFRVEHIAPTGLSGWGWGRLHFDGITLTTQDMLLAGNGEDLFRTHFDHFRPLVAATALGGAARAVDLVRSHIAGRLADGSISRVRDDALQKIARAHMGVHSALLGVLVAQHKAARGESDATTWAKMVKAHGVDTALRAAELMATVVGAPSYQMDHPIAKIRRDLEGLRFADGIHSELNRSAGRELLRP